MLTKELERRAQAGTTGTTGTTGTSATDELDAFKYVAFEDQFRGSREDIRDRLRDYLPIFAGCKDVLDVGCGRGELLDLLREQGVSARGIDLNPTMVDVCRERGLGAERADALGYLQGLGDGSLGGLVAIQVVEHLEPSYLLRFLNAAFDKLRPGAPMVLETLNPACWVAFFESYIRDITHRWPLHPETLSFLVQASGFRTVDVQWRAPVPEADKLPSVVLPPPPKGTEHDPTIVDLAGALNAHAEKLNARMFTYLDYAVVAKR
jgi:O-antigen chain-terminating methyltransferase